MRRQSPEIKVGAYDDLVDLFSLRQLLISLLPNESRRLDVNKKGV